MNVSLEYMDKFIAPYRPTVPLDQLVEHVNRFYHAVEAAHYDERHPEIHRFLPPIWREMIHRLLATRSSAQWSILDYGCGTGFEAEQIVRNFPTDRIARLTCYDPSPEMLAVCREKIGPLCSRAVFTSRRDDLINGAGQFNLLSTNSLLHHMAKPWEMINDLLPLLTDDAMWLQGHEPSRRFYDNAECLELFQAYVRMSRWRRWICPSKYFFRLNRLLRPGADPATAASRESYRLGLFGHKPPARVMGRLVDFHVAHSAEEAGVGKGFDFHEMEKQFGTHWRLALVTTYSYMGDRPEYSLPERWKRAAAELKLKHPDDGSNFSCIWRRI